MARFKLLLFVSGKKCLHPTQPRKKHPPGLCRRHVPDPEDILDASASVLLNAFVSSNWAVGGHSFPYWPRFLVSAMSFNPLIALSALTPPPPNLTEDYDGIEYRWKMFTFRPACKFT